MKTTIHFYSDNYQFKSETLEGPVTKGYVREGLLRNYAAIRESLWATAHRENKEVARFKIDKNAEFFQAVYGNSTGIDSWANCNLEDKI